MSLCRKSTKTFTCILFLLCAVFLLHLIITPMAVNRFSNATNKQSPFHLLARSFIVVDFTGNEILTDMEINHVINRNLRDFQRQIARTFDALGVLVVGLGLMLYYMQSLIRKVDQRKPILSTSVGGHAPPMM
ncbi:MAG: hypothetical protein ACYDEX_02430 [Mobilitalea sp.]